MVVMPTGSGKSLCYQLPALLRDDLTVVVSPLVALMQDQVEALRARGLGDRVALVNAQQDPAANAEALRRAAEGELRLLYVAPERFAAPGFLERMSAEARVGLFVVDEAHCVSQWGHDFRPDYFRLADAARALGAGAILASTATATPRVAADVVRAARPARPVAGGHRLRQAEHLVRGGTPGGPRESGARGGGAAWRRRRVGAPGDRLRGYQGRVRGAGGTALRGARRGGGGLPRRARSRAPRRGAAPVPVR